MDVGTIIVGVSAAALGGIASEALRTWRERKAAKTLELSEIKSGGMVLGEVRVQDEAERRREVEETSRQIREYLAAEVGRLLKTIEELYQGRAAEREKWHNLLAELKVSSVELELEIRREKSNAVELEEAVAVLDKEIKILKRTLTILEGELIVAKAKLERDSRERERLANRRAGETQ